MECFLMILHLSTDAFVLVTRSFRRSWME